MYTIIVPLDGSERSEQALPTATRLARTTGAVIQLVHVLEDDAFLELAPDGSAPPITEAEDYLLRTQQQLPPDVHSSISLTTGEPDAEIAEIAARTGDVPPAAVRVVLDEEPLVTRLGPRVADRMEDDLRDQNHHEEREQHDERSQEERA